MSGSTVVSEEGGISIDGLRTDPVADRYTAPPKRDRSGVALCLSGGGFRATLFHLGALRRLNELGILSQVTTVTSVSGGSIAAAFLATRVPTWPALGTALPDWENVVAEPVRAFTRRNLRSLPVLAQFCNWYGTWGVDLLQRRYEERISRLRLRDLPTRPRFVFCATDLHFGVNWTFERETVGDYQHGRCPTPSDWTLGRAVAASTCFPPVFNPMVVRMKPEAFRGGHAAEGRAAASARVLLNDGGNYDNFGLEPVWKTHKTVLASDGGATFDFASPGGIFGRVLRYVGVLGNQVAALRKRWLIAAYLRGEYDGAYWGVGSCAANYGGTAGYGEGVASRFIAKVRTDLDAFRDAEIAILENHGYSLAEAAVQAHLLHLVTIAVPFAPPHPGVFQDAVAQQKLSTSHRLSVLGRR